MTLTGPDGFYASLWTSKTNWGGNNPSFELDEYVGKHTDLWGTDLNVEAYLYSYPDFNRVKAGTKAATLFNHFSLLATTEQLLGLGRLGQAASASTMTKAFNL